GFYSFRVSSADPGQSCTNVVFRNNSATAPVSIECASATGVRLVGNLSPLSQFLCDARFSYSHNVWDGAACGPSDKNAPSGFVDAAASNLYLLPNSAAIDAGDPTDFPATDIDGRPRVPRGRSGTDRDRGCRDLRRPDDRS